MDRLTREQTMEIEGAKAAGFDAIIPSELESEEQWRRNGVYVPWWQVEKALASLDAREQPSAEADFYCAAHEYVRDAGAFGPKCSAQCPSCAPAPTTGKGTPEPVIYRLPEDLNEMLGSRHSGFVSVESYRALKRAPADTVAVPREPTREMLNAAVDVDAFKLGDISPLGFRCSPQQLFERCYKAMLSAAPKEGA